MILHSDDCGHRTLLATCPDCETPEGMCLMDNEDALGVEFTCPVCDYEVVVRNTDFKIYLPPLGG